MSEKVSEEMGIAVNWQDEIGTIAGPFDGNRKSWLARASRAASVPIRQIKALYYGESDDPRHSIALKILSAAERARIEEARRDAAQVANFCRRHAETLAASNSDLDRAQADAFFETARILGDRDRT